MLERVNLNETPLINPLALDYLNNDAFLKDFFSYYMNREIMKNTFKQNQIFLKKEGNYWLMN